MRDGETRINVIAFLTLTVSDSHDSDNSRKVESIRAKFYGSYDLSETWDMGALFAPGELQA
jgi:hypothetical protein